MKIFEGGNVFKDPKGQPLTQNINQTDVKPTVAWLDQMLPNLDLLNNMLGSTGLKPTSGDLDLAIDEKKITKEQLEAILGKWALSHKLRPEDYIRKSGNSVHFRTPIIGNPRNGYVQTDFMILPNVSLSLQSMRSDPTSNFKDGHKHVLLSSIAKSQGLKWVPTTGLWSRTSNKLISSDLNEVADMLLGKGRTAKDIRSVESILAVLKTDKHRDEKIKDFQNFMSREGVDITSQLEETEVSFIARLRDRIVNQGMEIIVEAEVQGGQAKGIEHLEDLVFRKGSRGIKDALDIISHVGENTAKTVTVKWDGCVHPDLLVTTNVGKIRIEEAIDLHNAGTELTILSRDLRNNKDLMCPILAAVKNQGVKRWVEILMDNGDILRVTHDHEIYTTNRKWVRAQELTLLDDIQTSGTDSSKDDK